MIHTSLIPRPPSNEGESGNETRATHMHSASKKIANNPIVHTRDSECTYLSISVAPVIITDSAPLALKEKLNTTFIRRVTTHKTNRRGALSET